MKKMTAPTMKRRDNIPYSKVIFRIPSEGNQESFFILDIESQERLAFNSVLPEMQFLQDVVSHVQDHVDHHDRQDVSRHAGFPLVHEEYRHADVDLQNV